jgi:hypothetical protein
MPLRMNRLVVLSSIVVIVTLVLGDILARADSPRISAASAVVREFFLYHIRDGCEFTSQNVNERKRWLSTKLLRLIEHEFARETEYRRTHPDEVPYYNGDPFTNSQEYPTRFTLGRSQSTSRQVEIEITFYFGPELAAERRTSRVFVIFERGAWRIDNIINDQGVSLQKELQRAEYNP